MSTELKRKYDKNPELIMRYREGDMEAGDEVVRLNTPLIYSIAQRFRDRCPDISDIIECGHIGLVKAMNTFDPSRGCAFSTYAVPLIFGEMRRFLRDDGIIKVSREERRLGAILAREREERQARGEPSDIATLARLLGISVEDAASAISSEAPVRSLDECIFDDGEGASLGSTLSDEGEEERRMDKLALGYAIERLADEERRVILLRYFRDMSQSEVARVLGLSQVKVSRLEKKIIEKLREHLS